MGILTTTTLCGNQRRYNADDTPFLPSLPDSIDQSCFNHNGSKKILPPRPSLPPNDDDHCDDENILPIMTAGMLQPCVPSRERPNLRQRPPLLPSGGAGGAASSCAANKSDFIISSSNSRNNNSNSPRARGGEHLVEEDVLLLPNPEYLAYSCFGSLRLSSDTTGVLTAACCQTPLASRLVEAQPNKDDVLLVAPFSLKRKAATSTSTTHFDDAVSSCALPPLPVLGD